MILGFWANAYSNFHIFTFLNLTIMKIFFLSILILGSLMARAQTTTENSKYNQALADSLGADEYGMKMYQFVILTTGPTVIEDKEALSKLFEGHFANINKLSDEGKLLVAGPFGKNDDAMRGLFILDVDTPEEAMELLMQDPTIEKGIFNVDIYPWYGSAALPMYLQFHSMIEMTEIK
jgi:uncharacterized protein